MVDTYFIEHWHGMLDSCLTEREARIFAQRYRLEEGRIDTLQTIADEEEISRERVRQILNRGLRKLASKANLDIKAGHHDTERAALVYHLRSIVVPDEEGHVDRLVSYLMDEFGHLPPDRHALTLLMRLVYKNKQEMEKYRTQAQRVLRERLGKTRRPRNSASGKSKGNLGAKQGGDRRAEIIQWLAGSRFAEPDETDKNFCVWAGNHIRLQNGQRHELLDWLKQEGIVAGTTVGGYHVTYCAADERHEARLSFSEVTSASCAALGIAEEWELPLPSRRALNREEGLPLRAYAPWSEAEECELARLFRAGLSLKQLARHFRRQSGAIRSRLKKLGLI